jgi:hypothetical protein
VALFPAQCGPHALRASDSHGRTARLLPPLLVGALNLKRILVCVL